jgi:hypothetical protein
VKIKLEWSYAFCKTMGSDSGATCVIFVAFFPCRVVLAVQTSLHIPYDLSMSLKNRKMILCGWKPGLPMRVIKISLPSVVQRDALLFLEIDAAKRIEGAFSFGIAANQYCYQ